MPRSILTCRNPVEIIYPSFPLLMSAMPSTSSLLTGPRMLSQVTKSLTNIINQPLHPNTVHQHLNKTGIKAVVKQKYPILSTRHYKAQLDFAYAHKGWTLDDWKKVVWSDETKINRLGSDGHK
jgi:hypothetical protein